VPSITGKWLAPAGASEIALDAARR